MGPSGSDTKRIVSAVAATVVALAAGTNYAYSAWAPQFGEQMKLSKTEINFIGAAGNLGMYASGIPMGLLTDARGPRLTTLLGAITLVVGYYPIYSAYQHGQGSLGVVLLSFFVFLTGLGSCSAFSASIKTAATNFPEHRGTATAFPLAAFGLSAFFWSTLSSLMFHGDTGRFLLLLTLGTFVLTLVSIPFLRLMPPSDPYAPVPSSGSRVETRQLRRAKSSERSTHSGNSDEPGMQSSSTLEPQHQAHRRSLSNTSNSRTTPNAGDDETTGLVRSSHEGHPDNFHQNHHHQHHNPERNEDDGSDDEDALSDVSIDSPHPDIRGLAMLPRVEFWQLFLTMGLLSGLGLMTINNIGNSTKALWNHYDDSASPKFIQQRQVMHVSILSFGNFIGRLSSGIGSDLLVKKLNISRYWCLFISAVVFTGTQLAGAAISNPNTLVFVSGMTGVAYGFLFGVFPSLVAYTFGIGGLSQNWGAMTMAPIISGNIFNVLYGTIYDKRSVVGPDGERDCPDGLSCYRAAYYTTFFSGVAGIAVCLWAILREKKLHSAAHKKLQHDRLA